MNFDFSDELKQLRDQARRFLGERSAPKQVRRVLEGHTPYDRALWEGVAEMGWLGTAIPEEYGGAGMGHLGLCILAEEMGRAVAAIPFGSTTYLAAEALILAGSPAQKAHWLPKIAAGELTFCIGMSEPNAGSDVAGTRTRAVKVDGGYRINGTKLWTSNAHNADYAILFCKMSSDDVDANDRHAGATQFLLDLKTPGVEIRPVINLLGEHHFNEIFLTDVFVPDHLLLGKEGNGWNQLTSELAFERSAPDRFLVLFQMLQQMIRMAGPTPDRSTAAALGKLISQLATLRSMSVSIAGMLMEGLQPNNESAVVKDLGTRYEQDIPVVARQLFATEPELEAIDLYASMLARSTMNAPRLSIQGGTREILRGIIARGLGLR